MLECQNARLLLAVKSDDIPEERSQQAETKAERYARRLRELGIDPDSIE